MNPKSNMVAAFKRKALSATPDKITWSNIHNDHWITTLESHGEDKLYYISEERGHKLNPTEALEIGMALAFLAKTVYGQDIDSRFLDILGPVHASYELMSTEDGRPYMPTENFSFFITQHMVYVKDRAVEKSDIERRKIRFPAVILLEEAEMLFSAVNLYIEAAKAANA